MPRIPDDQIERLKQEISLQRLAEGAGVILKRHGADLIGLCPFHDDHDPSLVISPKNNLWHCLGACQSGGSVIDWVMKAEGVSFRHAVELLLADDAVQGCTNVAGGTTPGMAEVEQRRTQLPRKPGATQPLAAGPAAGARPPGAPAYRASLHIKRSTVRKLPTTLEASAEDARLLVQVVDYYHETLKGNPEALAYLEKRGLASSEAIERFKLGFANRTLGYRLPAKNRKEGAAIRGQLQRIGLLRSSGHEHFSGSIVIPIMDEQGQVTEVYGRKVNDNLRKGTPRHLYLPGPHRGVWNADALQASKEIILCESLIDALTFWCAGYRNVTASYGIEGFTDDHLHAFKQHDTERILIGYDRDAAGETAAETLSKQLNKEGIDCYRIHFPKGMDANEYALQVKPATKSLGVVIRSANWLGKGDAHDARDGGGRAMPGAIAEGRANVAGAGCAGATKTKSVTTEAVAGEIASVALSGSPTPEPDAAQVSGSEDESAIPLAAKEEPPEPLPAAVVPDAPKVDIPAEVSEREVIIALGDRRYRIRGLEKNLAYDLMKVNLLVSRPAFDGAGDAVHVDTFDLYQQRPRGAFIKQTAVELGVKDEVVKADLGKILLKLEALQAEMIQGAKDKPVTLSDEQTQAALALLKSRNLLTQIGNDFCRCGVVGEETNKRVGYLAALSRKLDQPLAVTLQSTSAAGKSALMDAVLAFMPEEDRVKYSAMTGQSLFYMGETDLQHKVLAIVEEEGASNAAYALKLLQSEGELTIASAGKDPVTGELKTRDYQVKGPVMIFLTTTAIDIDEELLNRCIVLCVDEGRRQTQAIHKIQRNKRTLQGLLAKADKQSILTLHQNAQRLLQPLAVVNPYGKHLTFVDDRTRTRRDHEKYLTLIDAIALLHQHQRPIKTVNHVVQGSTSAAGGQEPGAANGQPVRYVEVTLDDIETANKLAHEVLGRTLDELPPQTRKLLRLIAGLVQDRATALEMDRTDYRFSRRNVREYTRWGNTQLKVHLKRLEELEYLLIHRGGRGQSFVYELLYDGNAENEQPHLSGLIDVELLRKKHGYDAKKSGLETNPSGPSRPQVGGMSGPGRGGENDRKASEDKDSSDLEDENAGKALFRPKKGNGSYAGHDCMDAGGKATHGAVAEEVPVSRAHDCMDAGGRAKHGARAEGCAGATRSHRQALTASATAPGVALPPASMQSKPAD